MADLTSKKHDDTYKDLLQVSNANAGVDGTLRAVEDGEGTTSALQISETIVNVAGTLQVNGTELSGDVEGPASSTNNALTRFDGTGGKTIQNSGWTLNDSDAMAGVSLTLTTDLAVTEGGTGASSLTDGGVLLGSGTSAITATAVLADSEMIVGDGTTDPALESGATLRTSIGVGTGDSPQFTGIELGNSSDTTLTRASSGNMNIEGNIVYRAGGTDVAVADGGTGVGTLTDGGVLLGSGTGAITAMAVLADSEMIVGNGTTDPVPESGATLRTSIGVPYGKNTIFIPANAMRPTASNGCASITDTETTAGRPDQQVLAFDASSDEAAQFQIAMPKNWDEGTITFRAYWTSSATDTDGVAIALQGLSVSDNVTIDAAYGTAVVVTDDAQSAAEEMYITAESSAVTIGGTPAEADMTFLRVFRDVSDANDDMAEDMLLIGIRILYTANAANDD